MKGIENSYTQFEDHASSGNSSTPIWIVGMVGQPVDSSLKRKLWRWPDIVVNIEKAAESNQL
jgi:ribosomal protein L39E